MKNTFWKFCFQVLLFLLLLVVVDKGVGSLFGKLKDVGLEKNPEDMWLKTAFVVEKVNSDVIIIGSSRASHHYVSQMIEDSLGLSTYNCGQDGCFFLYQNCVINMLIDHYTPKTIIWDIQPGSFDVNSRNEEYQNIRYLSPYYYNGNPWAIKYINSESAKMEYRMLSQMFGYNSKALNYIAPLLKADSKTDLGYLPLPNEGYKYPILNDAPNDVSFEIPQDYLDLLGATIKRCKEAGVTLELFISPAYSVKNNAILAAERAIDDIAKSQGIICHNYHSDDLFMDDSTYFKDAGHLNDKGARKFTELVIDVLK